VARHDVAVTLLIDGHEGPRLRRPPRLRTLEAGPRHVSYLEPFFDLVFVVAIACTETARRSARATRLSSHVRASKLALHVQPSGVIEQESRRRSRRSPTRADEHGSAEALLEGR
jgi:hypothetical protein